MYRSINLPNRILPKKWVEYNMRMHLLKLQQIRDCTKAYTSNQRRKSLLTKNSFHQTGALAHIEKNQLIKKNNDILLSKVKTIEFNSQQCATFRLPPKSLNSQKRKHDIIRIMNENQVPILLVTRQKNLRKAAHH